MQIQLFLYCIPSVIDAAYQPVIRDVFVRELVVTVRIHPIIPEGRSYNGIVQVIVLSQPSPANREQTLTCTLKLISHEEKKRTESGKQLPLR